MVKTKFSDELELSVINRLLEEMKVFTMNDCDKVAAISKERAIQFYSKETGFTVDEIEEYAEEVDKHKEKKYFPMNELTPEELAVHVKDNAEITNWGGFVCVLLPYDFVIRKQGKIYPYIISSTEY